MREFKCPTAFYTNISAILIFVVILRLAEADDQLGSLIRLYYITIKYLSRFIFMLLVTTRGWIPLQRNNCIKFNMPRGT